MDTKKISIDYINEQYGKIPPQAVEIEEAVLGAYIRDEYAYAINPVNPDVFYKKEHQIICSAIKTLCEKQIPIDTILLTKQLRNDDQLDACGGLMRIAELSDKVVTSDRLPFHLATIKQEFIKREIIRKASEIQNAAFDGSVELEDLVKACEDLALTAMDESQNSTVSFSDTLPDLADRIAINQYDDKKLSGVPTGLMRIDKHTGGHQKQDFTIIIAFASDGKTSLAVQMAKEAAIEEFPVGICTLEMSAMQLSSKIISQDCGVPSKSILNEKLTPDQIREVNKSMKDLASLPIHYEDRSSNKIAVVCNFFRRAVVKYGIKLGIVDFLQLCEGEGDSATERAGHVARSLKNLAKELDIPIIGLAQLVKNSERKEPPQIKDILWSAEIEQAADNVISLWQPGRWLPQNSTWEYSDLLQFDFSNSDNRGITHVAFLKGRNIGFTDFLLTFRQNTTKFLDYIGDRVDMYDENIDDIETINPATNFYEKENSDDGNMPPF
jgi:replicative DNA helicase